MAAVGPGLNPINFDLENDLFSTAQQAISGSKKKGFVDKAPFEAIAKAVSAYLFTNFFEKFSKVRSCDERSDELQMRQFVCANSFSSDIDATTPTTQF